MDADVGNTKKKKYLTKTQQHQILDSLAASLNSSPLHARRDPDDRTKSPNVKTGSDYLRGKVLVKLDDINEHVSRFICRTEDEDDTEDVEAIASTLAQIQECHDSLFFPDESNIANAAAAAAFDEEDKVTLSQPSGLRNLGATCYLNSQLQCLAQNLGFIHGLLSWKKPTLIESGTLSNSSKRMSEVLSHMQSILVRMRYGPDRVLCTNEFASALNLENNEMQDPNEVSLMDAYVYPPPPSEIMYPPNPHVCLSTLT